MRESWDCLEKVLTHLDSLFDLICDDLRCHARDRTANTHDEQLLNVAAALLWLMPLRLDLVSVEGDNIHMTLRCQTNPPENFLYKMGGLKALTSMSFCSERLFFCIFMYFKTD